MIGWKLIVTAPHVIGRPLLLYPRPSDSQGAAFASVAEGYWDGQQWQTALAAQCATHWMPMPPPPLTVVDPRKPMM
jgi:Protein of unknown function (DUF551)